ncbi:MAG: zinc-dependent metalloprotease [Fimbriimonadaceae bacterium]
MRRRPSNSVRTPLLAAAFLVATGVAVPAPGGPLRFDPVTLRLQGEVDQIARYKTTVSLEFSVEGQNVELVVEQVERAKVVSVDADGTLTLERKVESSKQTIEGNELPSEEAPPPSTIVLNPNGTLVSYSSDEDEETKEFSARMSQAGTIVFPEEEVEVGHKWSHDFTANSTLGTQAAKASYVYEANEEAAGAACAKVKASYAESGAKGMKVEGTYWVELASGDVVKSKFEYQNVALPGAEPAIYGTARGEMERTEGGLMQVEGQEEAGEQEKPKTIDETTEGFEKIEGQFTFYKKVESGETTLYLEIPASLLGKWTMLQATASSGTSSELVAGDPLSDLLFQFQEVRKDKLTMVVPNYLFRAKSGYEIKKAVERSFADAYVEQFDIEARQEDRNSILIDVSEFFVGNISGIEDRFEGGGPMAALMGGGGGSFSLDSSSTYVTSIKSFPENSVVEALYNFQSRGNASLEDMVSPLGADGRSRAVRVTYNLYVLPEDTGFEPRIADSRVGYFTVSFQDFTRDRERNQMTQWINRWNLVKKDPSAAVSEPVKPIEFWLDNAIPKSYRDSVRDSLLMWNPALEAAGFKDAIVVKQMSDDPEFDTADMRYNVVRWVASPGDAYAVANFRVNPMTGEIINASITVDTNIMRAATGELENIVRPLSRQKDPFACDCLHAGLDQAALAWSAMSLLAEPGQLDEERYIKEFIESFVVHEMGHILGLRHNFVASTQLSAEELGTASIVGEKSTAASVMDYIPLNFWALGKEGLPYYGPGLGDYDKWAIRYGYADFGAPGTRAEESALAELAAKNNESGLGYQSDEAADSIDPYVSRFDLGSDPLGYWAKNMSTAKWLLRNLDERLPGYGKSYYELTREYERLLRTINRSTGGMTRFVGGLRRNANYKGDAGEQPTLKPVQADVQRAALKQIAQDVLAPGSIKVPSRLLDRFAPNPDAGLVESFLSGVEPHNVLDELSNVPKGAVRSLLAPDLLSRVVNNEFKTMGDPQRFTLAELFQALDASVWDELRTGAEIDAVRRETQRAHMDTLTGFLTNPPPGLPADARTLALQSVKTLGQKIANAASTAKGPYGRAHLEDILSRIAKALNAVQTISGRSQSAPSLLEQLLGGG